MPTLTTEHGREYEVDGKYLTWTTDAWEDEKPTTIRLPLRIKLGAILKIAEAGDLNDNSTQLKILLSIVPAARKVLEDMDVNDFRQMFETWLTTYNTLTGTTLGE